MSRLFPLWTKEEDNILKRLWPELIIINIAERMNRSPASVERRARRLYLPHRIAPLATRGWKYDEDKILGELWCNKEVPVPEIAHRLGRSRNAVIGRAHRLQLPTRGRLKAYNNNAIPTARKPRRKAKRGFVLPSISDSSRVAPTPIVTEHYDGSGVEFMDIGYGQCRAVMASSHDRHGLAVFCGQPVPSGSKFSFCRHHLELYVNAKWR
jgi:hypothetical protein